MAPRTKRKHNQVSSSKNNNDDNDQQDELKNRLDPAARGIHPDALAAGRAPSAAASCVACRQKIAKQAPRWGIKYAGNPLPGKANVIPLYGSHPMVMWLHAGGCGLQLIRTDDKATSKNDDDKDTDADDENMIATGVAAEHTCHACSDAPSYGLRIQCGGPTKGKKIQSHAFHIGCWVEAMRRDATDAECLEELLLSAEGNAEKFVQALTDKNGNGGDLTWDSLTADEQDELNSAFARDEQE